MQVLSSDMNRVFGKPFALSLLGVTLCVLFGAFSEILKIYQMRPPATALWAHQGILVRALAGEPILFAAPILAAIPFSGAFVEDVKSGYLKQVLPRTTVTKYIWSKELACAVSGFLTLAIGIFLGYVVVILLVIPVETFSGAPVESQLPELLGKLGLFGLAGALWAMLGMLLSTVTMNAYMAYSAPFILYYVLIILQERYARSIFMLNPQNYLTLTGKWPFGGWSAAITVLTLLIAVMLGFYIVAQKHLRDDNARRQLRVYLPSRQRVLDRPFRPARETGPLRELRQIGSVVRYNFRMWRSNARIGLTFALAFILCFLLSDKAAAFAYEMETTMQAFEPFVWTFGDANSVLLVSLLLILLFVDMPFLGAGVPYYLIRIWWLGTRKNFDLEKNYAFIKKVTKAANRAGRVTIESYGVENIPKENGFIFFPNHQGMFDALVFLESCPVPFSVVYKKEVSNVILLKQVFRALHAIAIDREDIKQSLQVINQMTEEVKQGRNFLIFPEGTRSRMGNQLLPFKGGTFKSAVRAKCPIVPCALIDSYKPFDEKSIAPVTVKLIYLPPICYEEYKQLKTPEIADIVKTKIEEAIRQYS